MFFDFLESTIKEYNIDFDCIYGADEAGFMPGCACTSKVIGKAGKKTQHRKESGNQQLITVMLTICADGTSIPPLVIFAEKMCRIGYQRKGYMDGELGVDWAKHFDCYTKDKMGDCDRLIERIHVICYPSHATHLNQGLDVVIFGILKQYFSKEMIDFESQTGQVVCKENFLSVYAPAHIAAFTPTNIKAAFAKTGIHPFNREAIDLTAMKPSIESHTNRPVTP
ncbi:hypothetical protein SCHPADRAFT_917911 [Schizopora paradoxa]|uniref:DDE-1 domain-containing protein n=1 Tax=Schizopora paradoxa TaxID=27342 RepID=A0A0H2R4S7_9AGAM|nr:hypothetical protein SCHPADRAFT_917911 [Schizopora paradoxa]